MAPHTSNWDFVMGKLFYATIGGRPRFLMKKEWFFFPLNLFLKAIGGIPVDRKSKTSLTGQLIEEFNHRDQFHLAVAPEGTRKRTENWKTGFYYIALGAEVPILLAYIDYGKKEIGIGCSFDPTGDEKEDMNAIKNFYKNFKGKYPEKFAV